MFDRAKLPPTLRSGPAAAMALAGLATLAWPTPARAQNPAPAPVPAPSPANEPKIQAPRGTVGAQAAATSGATNLDDGKVATAVIPAQDVTDATELDLSAGGLFNSGNARTLSMTAGGRFRIRRKAHEFSASLAGNYGRASVPDVDGASVSRSTAGNVQARLRYDYFFHPRISFFAMGTTRYDPFLGLTARIRADPGLAFFAIQQPKHRLWGELGYDFQYDVRRVYDGVRQDCQRGGVTVQCHVLAVPNVPLASSALVVDRTLAVHSMRMFAGYINQLGEIVTFTTGLEYIQALSPLRSSDTDPPNSGDPVSPRLRMWVNWDAALTVAVRKNLAFATTFTLRHDNAPLPGVRRLDTITAVTLTYRFF
jgi:putative salt-induced outer membrane protein